MMSDRPSAVLFDARCLQDPGFRHRGIGQHAANLVAGARTALGEPAPRLVAIVDPRLPPLFDEFAGLFEEIRPNPNPGTAAMRGPSWFVQLSPLTHPQTRFARMLATPEILKAAVFYDAIPAEFADLYLTRAETRLDYLANAAWLRKFDHFAPISEHARTGLGELLGLTPAPGKVSGVAVRPSLLSSAPPPGRSERRHILVASGADPRKNAALAVRAFAASAALNAANVSLQLFGGADPQYAANMRTAMVEAGGNPDLLVLRGQLSDDELRDLYRTALLAVVPSYAEGFSIPVIEANAAATPVLVSAIGAHRELISDPDALFDPDDEETLRVKMEALVRDEAHWRAMQHAQRNIWRRFEPQRVAQRFWEGVREAAHGVAQPAVLRDAKPSIAFLSPMHPTISGIADYSNGCLADLSRDASMHVFTDTPAARVASPNYASLRPISAHAYTSPEFDAVISVMGNSHLHLKTFRLLADYGGACISHDVRMLDFYVHLIGIEKARRLAERESGMSVSLEDVRGWLADPGTLPVPLLSEIREHAEPFFVHSPTTSAIIEKIGGRPAVTLPFAIMRDFNLAAIDDAGRAQARQRLGYDEDEIVITSFGFLTNDKALSVVVWSAEVLVGWGYNVRLVFCGSGPEPQLEHLRWLARETDLTERLTIFDTAPSNAVFQDHLVASDAAIQLRTYYLGSISGALSDCVGAALPAVANAHLADGIQAPSFIRRVPDHLSPILIAEQAADIIEARRPRSSLLDEVRAYRRTHSIEEYNTKLLNTLGFERRRR